MESGHTNVQIAHCQPRQILQQRSVVRVNAHVLTASLNAVSAARLWRHAALWRSGVAMRSAIDGAPSSLNADGVEYAIAERFVLLALRDAVPTSLAWRLSPTRAA
jgi:hypothetical protein